MLWLSIILLPLFAALWILALLAVNDAIDELHYAYSFVALVSSLYIFIGYCLVNRRVRHNIQLSWQRVTSAGGSPGPDESFSGTRTSMTGSRGALYHASPGGAGGQASGQQAGSSFDVYGMRAAMALDSNVISGQVISSSSTTSRSTVTKGSGAILDGEEPVDTMDETEETDGYGRHRHRHRHHHHHKCHRRHRRGSSRRHHRSKQSITATETGSSDDASYDRSLDLASSHSSDEEEDGPGQMTFDRAQMIRSQMNPEEMMQQQQENQINCIIAEHQKQGLYGQTGAGAVHQQLHPTATSSTLGQANSSDTSGANTVIYGQRNMITGGGTPAILKQNADNPNQAHLVTSMPFSRSNILAMTAGLSETTNSGGSGAGSTSLHQTMVSPSAGGGGNTPSPAPPLTGISPASSIHSHIYQSGSHMSGNIEGKHLPQSTSEHIYSYARKPVSVLAPIHSQVGHAASPSSIYSTVGPKTGAPVISDEIGLPAIVPPNALTYRHSGTLPHLQQHRTALMGSSVYQSMGGKENPYGISTHSAATAVAASAGASSSHVRLLNPSEPDLSTAVPHEAVDNSRNEANESSRVSSSRQYLLNSNTDSSNG